LYNPVDETNKAAVEFAAKVIEVHCEAIAAACRTTAVSKYIEDGCLARANQTKGMEAKVKDTHRSNDKHTESVFGMVKEEVRKSRGVAAPVAAGVVSAKKMGLFDDSDDETGPERVRRAPSGGGSSSLAAGGSTSSSSPPAPVNCKTPFRLKDLGERQLEALISMVSRWRKKFNKLDIETIAEQRRLAYEKGKAAGEDVEVALEKKMEAAWEVFLRTTQDSAETVEATVTTLLAASQKDARITHKDNKAIDYVWGQLRLYGVVLGLKVLLIQKEGATLQSLKSHLLTELAKNHDIPDEPVLTRTESGLKTLGRLTPQGLASLESKAAKRRAALTAARTKAAAAVALGASRRKTRSPGDPVRLRNRERPGRVPAPAITNALVGKAIEFGFGWELDEVVEVDVQGGFVGRHIRKEFSGERFLGIVVGVVGDMEDEGAVFYKVKYEDDDEEELTREEIEPLVVEGKTGTWQSIRHLYGEIEQVKVVKTKVGKSKKTTTTTLLFIRWDTEVYDDGDEEAREWVAVTPVLYGTAGEGGWEIVPVRPVAEEENAGMVNDLEEGGGEEELSAEESDDTSDSSGDDEESSDGSSDDESDEGGGSGAEAGKGKRRR